MFFKKKPNCFIVRAFYPASVLPASGNLKQDAMVICLSSVSTKEKDIGRATEIARNKVIANKGIPFLIYHVPGFPSATAVNEEIKKSSEFEKIIVWEDRSLMTMFNLLIDYTLDGESVNDTQQLKAYTIDEAVDISKALVEQKGGIPVAVQHVMGEHTVEQLREFADGKISCVSRMVWFDEGAMYDSLTFEEVEALLGYKHTDNENIIGSIAYEMNGLDAPGLLIPPTRGAV